MVEPTPLLPAEHTGIGLDVGKWQYIRSPDPPIGPTNLSATALGEDGTLYLLQRQPPYVWTWAPGQAAAEPWDNQGPLQEPHSLRLIKGQVRTPWPWGLNALKAIMAEPCSIQE